MIRLYTELLSAQKIAFSSIEKKFSRLIQEDRGATAVEYALIVGLIAVAIIVAVTLLGTNISALFNHAACVVKGGTWNATTSVCS